MPMESTYTLYEEAQILMAVVRLFQHLEKRPPTVAEAAERTRFSVEAVHHLCNRLEKLGALERIRSAFEDRIVLRDPLKAEALRGVEEPAGIEAELKKWKEQRSEAIREVEKRFAEGKSGKEREERYAKIEERLRKGAREETPSPLDALFPKDLGKKDSP